MRTRRVIRALISVYLWGFIVYQSTPVRIVPYTNYAPRDLSPVPVIYTYSYAYDVRTAFKHHAGSIGNLIEALRDTLTDFAFGDFPEVIAYRLYPMPKENPCRVVSVGSVNPITRIMHLLFEILPSKLVFMDSEGVISRQDLPPAECYVVAHSQRVLVSTFLGLDLPPYSLILSSGRNVFFSREVLIRSPDPEEVLRSTIALLEDAKITAFAYSERSFYLPGEGTHYNFRYVFETDVRNPLVYLYKDGEVFGIYAQNRINLPVLIEGSYTVIVRSYKFRISVLYFGLRTVAIVPPIRLM